ncbi:hypothetical protein D3C87_1671230 [compost metagenome]
MPRLIVSAERMTSAIEQENARAWPTRRIIGPAITQPTSPPKAIMVTAAPGTQSGASDRVSTKGT